MASGVILASTDTGYKVIEGSFLLSVLLSLSAGLSFPTSVSPRGPKPSALFQGWCCYKYPGPWYWLKVSARVIWTRSQKNFEANAVLLRLSGPWAIFHILFPIPCYGINPGYRIKPSDFPF